MADLARFFPEATPVRIPVQLTRSSLAGESQKVGAVGLLGSVAPQGIESGSVTPATAIPESTVIEFGTSREVLFACTMALEFADVLRLRNSDGSLDTEASVVAARFLKAVPNWIVKS